MKSSEDLRLELTVQSTLDHTSEQSKKISGKDKMAFNKNFWNGSQKKLTIISVALHGSSPILVGQIEQRRNTVTAKIS